MYTVTGSQLKRHRTRGHVPVKVVAVRIWPQLDRTIAVQQNPTRDINYIDAIEFSNGRAEPIKARHTTAEHARRTVIVPACVEDDIWEADVAEKAVANDGDMGGGESGRTCMEAKKSMFQKSVCTM